MNVAVTKDFFAESFAEELDKIESEGVQEVMDGVDLNKASTFKAAADIEEDSEILENEEPEEEGEDGDDVEGEDGEGSEGDEEEEDERITEAKKQDAEEAEALEALREDLEVLKTAMARSGYKPANLSRLRVVKDPNQTLKRVGVRTGMPDFRSGTVNTALEELHDMTVEAIDRLK